MSRQEPLIFVVSGETSGDNLAGRLMGALKEQTGGRVRFAGVGGPMSAAHGLESLFPMHDLSVMGLAEVLPHLPRLIKRLNQTAAAARELKPDVIVTVDSPGFCLRLAHKMRGSGIPIVHYVAPQLWAWRPGRAHKLAERVDHLMALLPFEVPFFANYGISCTYVGHSAIESGATRGDGPEFRERHGLPADGPVLCVLPGSRSGEVRRILPVFGEALRQLIETYPDLHVVIPVVTSVAEEVGALTKDWPLPVIHALPKFLRASHPPGPKLGRDVVHDRDARATKLLGNAKGEARCIDRDHHVGLQVARRGRGLIEPFDEAGQMGHHLGQTHERQFLHGIKAFEPLGGALRTANAGKPDAALRLLLQRAHQPAGEVVA